jgi:hypothetical protein
MTNVTNTELKNLTVSRIFSEKRKDVDKAILKLNKKCERLGVSNPTVTLSNEYEHKFTDGTYEDDPFAVVEGRYKWYAIDVFDITITLPEEIKFGDWEAIAFIEHFEKQHIQFDIDADYDYDFEKAIDDKTCEHCNTKRNRRKSFILKSTQDDSFKKVGSTCVKDFTGVDPTKFFKAFQHILNTLERFVDLEFNRSSPKYVDYRVLEINHIWTISKKVLEVDGKYIKTEWKDIENPAYPGYYTQVRTNMGDATSDKVKSVLFDYNENSDYFVKPSFEDEVLIKNMREWLTNFVVRTSKRTDWDDKGNEIIIDVPNDFDSKIQAYAERKRVRTFDIGFTGWIVDAYNQYVESLTASVSEFQGEVGNKIKVDATIISVSGFNTDYGWSNIYKMTDVDGNVYTKFGKINTRYADTDGIDVGTVIKVTAVVKKHNDYKGKKETVLGRVSKF